MTQVTRGLGDNELPGKRRQMAEKAEVNREANVVGCPHPCKKAKVNREANSGRCPHPCCSSNWFFALARLSSALDNLLAGQEWAVMPQEETLMGEDG